MWSDECQVLRYNTGDKVYYCLGYGTHSVQVTYLLLMTLLFKDSMQKG